MLLENENSLYTPAAFHGFDNTTIRRLRIPVEIIDQLDMLKKGDSLHLENYDRDFLESFFSVREFGLYSQILIIPFINSEHVHGFLLIGSDEDDTISVNISKLTAICDKAASIIERNYLSVIQKLPSLPDIKSHNNFSEQVEAAKRILTTPDDRILVFTINIEEILSSPFPQSLYTDKFRFEKDILRILHSFCPDSGLFFQKSEKEILLGFPALSNHNNIDLMKHHLLVSLSDFFPGLQPKIFSSGRLFSSEEIGSEPFLSDS